MDLQPTLTGKLLTLRPLASADFDDLFLAAADRMIWDQHPFPRYEKTKFSEFFDQALATKSALVILNRETGKTAGTSRYYNQQENKIWIGYTFLARSHWGGTYNRELKTLMIGHALKSVSEVFFDVGENNKRSRRAMEKIGASFEKLQDIKGQPYTLYRMDQQAFAANLGR